MNLIDFIKLFDKKLVESTKIGFTFHCKGSGKWNFWCEDKCNTVRKLCNAIKKHECLMDEEIAGFETVYFEPWMRDGVRVIVHLDGGKL